MARLRFLTGLVAPGGVLLLAAWALDHEAVVREVAAPYAIYFCFGALAAAVLLSWYHDQSVLLGVALAVALTVLGRERWPDDTNNAMLAATFLLPLNFVLFASLKDRGVMTFDGVFKIGMVGAQAAAVAWIAEPNTHNAGSFLHWGEQTSVSSASALSLTAQLSYTVAALTLLALVVRRRTKVEQGLFWALAAIFLGVHNSAKAETLFLYAGTAGLVLVFAVLEHGYDIAYRDELTGLLGRRAFTSLMERLGRTYAFAICDVDHFKQFNDKYGHDVGDDVLKMVAAKLSHVEGGGRVFRYGGEEFLVVFRGRSAREAKPFMESVRHAIADTGFKLRGAERPARKPAKGFALDIPAKPLAGCQYLLARFARLGPLCGSQRVQNSRNEPHSGPLSFRRSDQEKHPAVTVTISVGIAEKSIRHSTPELVLDAADAALYAAKAAGRNCVRLDETIPA